MKKILIILVLLTGYLFADNANDPLAAYLKEGKWIVINQSGKEIFSSYKIFEILGYSENSYRVRLLDSAGKRTWAFLDDKGEIMFKPKTAIIFDFHDGIARSAQKNPWSRNLQIFGYYDKNGNEVVPHVFDDAIDFNEGMAYVMNADKNGFIDKTGKFVIPLDSIAGNTFSEGLAAINTKDFKVGYLDKQGNMKIKYRFDEGHPFSEGKAVVYYNGKFGYIDKSGKDIIKSRFDFANSFKENHAFVAMARDFITYTADWGFIDTTGSLISGFKYLGVNDFSEGLAAVKIGDKWGFINYTDSLIITNKFTTVGSFKNGLAFAADKENDKYGFIDKKGEWVIVLPGPEKLLDLRLNKKLK